jgi:NAD(P)-dependent dehydrogenase (short-subunit alcohol dehydrogenase family)
MTPAPDVSGRSLEDLYRLDGRVALVTGGARGIGEAVARRLAEAGAPVVIGDFRIVHAEETAASIRAAGASATAVALDVTDEGSIRKGLDEAVARVGPIDILINNAGVMPPPAMLVDIDTDEWDRVFAVNVTGLVKVSREVARRMIDARNGGVIVNLASTASYRVSNPGTLTYTASKHAVNAVTKAMAVELGPHGIRVLDVAPTMVETPGIAELREAAAAQAAAAGRPATIGQTDAFASLPLGRNNVPDDVARVIVFMVSDLAVMLTGSTIAIDAGSMVVR